MTEVSLDVFVVEGGVVKEGVGTGDRRPPVHPGRGEFQYQPEYLPAANLVHIRVCELPPLLLDVERRGAEICRLGDAHAVERADRCAGEYVDPPSGFFKVTEQLDQSARLESAPGATT